MAIRIIPRSTGRPAPVQDFGVFFVDSLPSAGDLLVIDYVKPQHDFATRMSGRVLGLEHHPSRNEEDPYVVVYFSAKEANG